MNEDQIEYWNITAGDKWVANQAKLDRLMSPLTQALLRIAFPEAGEAVLDVGCGCGDLSLQLAEKVGARGQVTAVDVSKPMLAHARARAETLPEGAARIEWLEADAMMREFEPIQDLLVSRFGVMFFEDRAAAFANLRKALKPMGRFAFLAWRSRAEVEWMQSPLEWIAPVLEMPESSDGEIGPFGLADGEGTREILADAGFRDVIAEPLDRELDFGGSVEEAAPLFLDTGPAAALIRDAPEAQRAEAETLVRQGLARSLRGDRVLLRGACWIYRGRAA